MMEMSRNVSAQCWIKVKMIGEKEFSTREIMYDIMDAQRHDPKDPSFQKRVYDRQRKRDYRKQVPHEMNYLKKRIEELELELKSLQEQRNDSLEMSWHVVAQVFQENAEQSIHENQLLRQQLNEIKQLAYQLSANSNQKKQFRVQHKSDRTQKLILVIACVMHSLKKETTMLSEEDVSTREIMYDIVDAQQHNPSDPTFQRRLYDRQRKREYRKQIPQEVRYLKQRITELEQQLSQLQGENRTSEFDISWEIVASVFKDEANQAQMENKALRDCLLELEHLQDHLAQYYNPQDS
ncbi:hypothetical protein THRCLA_20183 [Thraustotheca clavata]|uniref:Uncharacterized protein n=1 Tax=Thraustotheca clavata TaxID=74557 RepID=A0A1W0AAE9_9STRA|nr:hypothetical protein THRCLA_20183 [Thraustotheca clavata]